MKKDHPWSRAAQIVAPHRIGVQILIWNSTFQKIARIELENDAESRYDPPRAALSHRRKRTTDF
ncbi:hypothetical protein [Paraburkholderia unamae]|uniref:hypothetical protein n=1 Tax=Paraburkholderia unamae TaxID=219649 RepID=UPI001CC4C401|nr:hypothetical protein [Paraburkholderia unamae]